MADDPNEVSRAAILQSMTTEAGGFYATITTVASTFLGASLLFFDKFVIARTTFSLVFLGVSWTSLVISLACVAHVRYLNLKSGRLVLRGKDASADALDTVSYRYSNVAQGSLIVGMAALVLVGLANVNNLGRKENAVHDPSRPSSPQTEQKTIPYGSLNKPDTAPVQTPAQTTTQTQTPASTPQPTTSQPNKKD
jgi:hypothetical protein